MAQVLVSLLAVGAILSAVDAVRGTASLCGAGLIRCC